MRGALHQRCSRPQLPGKQPVCALDTSRSKLVSRARPSAASASDYTTATTSTLESSVDEAAQATSCREALLSLGIPPTPPEELFDSTHIDPQDITPALLAYAPFGCVLALVRMAAWVAGIALDASWFRHKAVVDAYMALLGVTVQWEGEEHIPDEVGVVGGCVGGGWLGGAAPGWGCTGFAVAPAGSSLRRLVHFGGNHKRWATMH